MSSRRGLPAERKMRADRHFVDELANHATTAVGFLLPVERIETNPDQPRSTIGDLSELTASIRAKGVLEPLLVRKVPDSRNFQLIAGERRFHAALEAGLAEVPCIEFTATDREALEMALVENLQRRDLSAFEEAEGYRTLVEKHGYTHEQVASAVGKSRGTVTETLRLLAMPPAIQDLCRHADIRAKSVLLVIARAPSVGEMERLVQEIVENNLDREGIRFAARHETAPGSSEPGQANQTGHRPAPEDRFRPRVIRFRPAPDAAVQLSFSIRRPDVSRDQVIASLESLLERLRRGELDDKISPLQAPGEREPS